MDTSANIAKSQGCPGDGPSGLLLVGHGTRDRIGRSEFHQLCEAIRERIARPTRACFLELAEPSIEQAVHELADDGVRQVVVVPLLLFAAGHAQQDIPAAVEAAARGRIVTKQAAHLGCHPKVVGLSAMRFREAAERLGNAPRETLAVLAGRGSREPAATSEMIHFVRLRQHALPARQTVCGFIAMASPSMEDALRDVGNKAAAPVVVQPHLLFHGELTRHMNELVDDSQRIYPDRIWTAAAHLGPHPLLADALIDRFLEVEWGEEDEKQRDSGRSHT